MGLPLLTLQRNRHSQTVGLTLHTVYHTNDKNKSKLSKKADVIERCA